MTEANTILIIVATLALMAVTTLAVIFLIRRRIGNRVVELEVSTDREWALGTVTEPGKRYNLCFSFSIEYPGGEDDYGLEVNYSCHAGSNTVVDEKAGIGHSILSESAKRISSLYNCDLTAFGGWNKYRATVILFSTGPFTEHLELRAAGSIAASSDTSLKKGVIFISTRR